MGDLSFTRGALIYFKRGQEFKGALKFYDTGFLHINLKILPFREQMSVHVRLGWRLTEEDAD